MSVRLCAIALIVVSAAAGKAREQSHSAVSVAFRSLCLEFSVAAGLQPALEKHTHGATLDQDGKDYENVGRGNDPTLSIITGDREGKSDRETSA